MPRSFARYNYPGIIITVMVRPMLTPAERERGYRLGALLRESRGTRSMTDVAAAAGIPVETLRKIETGRVPTPAFFTIVAIAATLDLRLADLVVWTESAAVRLDQAIA
jgi:DNA-binding phage protein